MLNSGDANDFFEQPVQKQNAKKQLNLKLTKVDRKSKRSQDPIKRPDGMHRELYNLLVHQGKDDSKIESMIPTNTKKGYTSVKPQLGNRKVRKWTWKPFVNQARKDDFQLYHWEREGERDPIYPFAKFNKVLEPVKYTDEEYEEYLQDPRWSKEETLHLLDLCHRFDLRWPIVEDRFDRDQSKSKRSMEDMKERYYNLVNNLNEARGVKTEPLAYDAENERRRKEQLLKLWARTNEQVKEEEELRAEIKRIEAKRKDRERKATEVQRLINSAERVSLSPDSSAGGSNAPNGSGRGHHRRSTKNKNTQMLASQLAMSPEAMHIIRWPSLSGPGPHLRSQEMKLPSNLGQKKAKNLETVVSKLEIEPYPHAFEDIVHLFNSFRSNVIFLQTFKTALFNAECELKQLAFRLKTEKDTALQIEPRMFISGGVEFGDAAEENSPAKSDSTAMDDDSTERVTAEGAPSSSRQITQWIDITNATLTTTKKRRTRHSPAPSVGTDAAERSGSIPRGEE